MLCLQCCAACDLQLLFHLNHFLFLLCDLTLHVQASFGQRDNSQHVRRSLYACGATIFLRLTYFPLRSADFDFPRRHDTLKIPNFFIVLNNFFQFDKLPVFSCIEPPPLGATLSSSATSTARKTLGLTILGVLCIMAPPFTKVCTSNIAKPDCNPSVSYSFQSMTRTSTWIKEPPRSTLLRRTFVKQRCHRNCWKSSQRRRSCRN